MPRLFLAAIAIATLALPGARAAADDCMCLGPDTLFLDARPLVDADALVEGVVLESPDDTIETVDPAAPELAEAPSAPRGPVAWCRSADDPRCRRDDHGQAPYRISLGNVPVATLLETPRIPAPGVVRIRFPQSAQRGSSGIAFRLDRPPRA